MSARPCRGSSAGGRGSSRTSRSWSPIDDTLTYGELERETAADARAASQLIGVGKGTRVGVLMPNGTSWPVVAIGASRAGATLVPLSTFLRPPELAAQLRVAGVEHLVVVPTFLGA